MWRPPEIEFVVEPPYRSDPDKKRAFGAQLAKGLKPFQAALEVFGADTAAALWASQNWLNDPVVAEGTISEEKPGKLLDKEGLADKVLAFCDEKDPTGRFYLNESKDRLAALKLYADICGFTGKVEIDASTKNFTNNEMKIILVSPPEKDEDDSITIEAEQQDNVVPLNIKLVG